MSSRIMIVLTYEELKAINTIAEGEFRSTRDQIKVILRREFESKGLLTQVNSSNDDVEKMNNGAV